MTSAGLAFSRMASCPSRHSSTMSIQKPGGPAGTGCPTARRQSRRQPGPPRIPPLEAAARSRKAHAQPGEVVDVDLGLQPAQNPFVAVGQPLLDGRRLRPGHLLELGQLGGHGSFRLLPVRPMRQLLDRLGLPEQEGRGRAPGVVLSRSARRRSSPDVGLAGQAHRRIQVAPRGPDQCRRPPRPRRYRTGTAAAPDRASSATGGKSTMWQRERIVGRKGWSVSASRIQITLRVRLLQRLKQGVLRTLGDPVGLLDDKDPVGRLQRGLGGGRGGRPQRLYRVAVPLRLQDA